jgi:MerR family transcriptional regulator, light-induced transcriptional regulator
MADHQNTEAREGGRRQNRPSRAGDGSVALTLVPSSDRHLDPTVLQNLRHAALGAERDQAGAALQAALDAGVARDDIADFYIPALARDMGEAWCSDNLSFAAVTIGVSRLQAMLGALGPDWTGDQSTKPTSAAIMVIVPPDIYHTLGAMVLAGQLRRKGMSVYMMVNADMRDIAEKLHRTQFDAVFISSSLGETLESLRRIVDVIKSAAGRSLPIVIGGTILEAETPKKVTVLTGADYATRIPSEALELCGLTTKYLTVAPSLHGA